MNNTVKMFACGLVAAVSTTCLGNSGIQKQTGRIKQDISNTGISKNDFGQLENRLGKTSLFDDPSASSEIAIKCQEALDSIKLDGADKRSSS